MRCPAQFERRYVLGEIIPPGIAARRGSATHKAAEINHSQKLHSGEDLPVADLQDAARDEYVRLVKEKGVFIPKDQVGDKGKLLAAGLDAATRLTKLYREELAPQIIPALVEENIVMDVGLDLPLEGTLDLVTVAHDLEDMKTADKSKSASEAENSLQLSFYSGLLAHKTGKWPGKARLRVLVNTQEPKMQTLETTRGPADFANLLLRLQFFIAQLETGLFPPCDPGAWICSPTWCGYWWTCKYSIKRR